MYFPYQLCLDTFKKGEDKYASYRKSRFDVSDEKRTMYVTLMSACGVEVGVGFKFKCTLAKYTGYSSDDLAYQEERQMKTADE